MPQGDKCPPFSSRLLAVSVWRLSPPAAGEMLISEWRAAGGWGLGVKVFEFSSTICLPDQHSEAVWSFVRSLMFAFSALYPSEDKKASLFSFPPKLSPPLHTFPCSNKRLPSWLYNTVGLSLSVSHKQIHTPTLDLVVSLLLALLNTICGCFTLADGCHGGVAWLAQAGGGGGGWDRRYARRRREIKKN